MKILFLEDDILLNEIIQEHLENEGYRVKSTFTEDSPNPSTVRTYIKNLRKILGEKFITNIRGVGYRFNK